MFLRILTLNIFKVAKQGILFGPVLRDRVTPVFLSNRDKIVAEPVGHLERPREVEQHQAKKKTLAEAELVDEPVFKIQTKRQTVKIVCQCSTLAHKKNS